MAGITFDLRGDKKLMRALKRLPEQVRRSVTRKALRAGGLVIREAAKARVPVDEGELRDGLHVVMRTEGGQPVAKVATAKKTFWGHFIEFGTVKMAARPFLRPAADEKRGEVVRVVREKLWRGIQAESRKLAR